MPSQRFLCSVVAASLLVGLAACGGGGGVPAIANAWPPWNCVVPPRVELRDNKIEIREKIQFEVNKAVIKPESFGLLKEIGDVIKKNPQIKKLSIEGHASAEGDAKANKKLSEDRAKSVLDYLVKTEKVDAKILASKGWGVEKPIGDNATEEGREKNRRVEFLVTEQDITQKKVEIDPATGKEKVVGETTTTAKTDPGPAAVPTTSTTMTNPNTKKGPPPPAGSAKPAPAPSGSAAPPGGKHP